VRQDSPATPGVPKVVYVLFIALALMLVALCDLFAEVRLQRDAARPVIDTNTLEMARIRGEKTRKGVPVDGDPPAQEPMLAKGTRSPSP
jgi:hypothetical protein